MANEYIADIPKGFNVPKQVRLDSITGVQNEDALKDLGSGNNLAFKYYEGLKIYCKDEKTEYVWREVIGVETGLLNTPFIYPNYNPVDGIDYSGKSFNFFLIPNSNTEPDGSETKLIEGTNVTITGTGTILDPYEISSSFETSQTFIEEGDNINITGVGTELNPYVIDADLTDLGITKTVDNEVIAPGQTLSIINGELTGKVLATKEYVESIIPPVSDGSETKLNAGDNVTITGIGTTLDPYTINSILVKKELISSTLIITEDIDSISIETPIISEIPALIVNSAYAGTEELGTASKPFKTIQGALDAYKGTGGKGTIADPTNPELLGRTIEIEKGSGIYTFTGDFNYKNVKIKFKDGAKVTSTPVSGWLMDFSLFSSVLSHTPILTFGNDAYLTCTLNGFKIIGVNLPSTGGSIFKNLSVDSIGEGGIFLYGTLESDILFEVDGSNLQYENGGYPSLNLTSRISINRGKAFVIKGKGIVQSKGNFLNIINDINETITNTYFPIELANDARLELSGVEFWMNNTLLVTYNQFLYLSNSAVFTAIDTIFRGTVGYFCYNNTPANTATVVLDSCKMYINTTSSFANTISGVWGNLILANNIMPNTTINSITTSIQPSSINTIGGKIIETLSIYGSKALAVIAGLPTGAKFINKIDITAGSFVTGVEYKILTIGTTDFTLIGASANTIGLYFTASGLGTGTGTASLIKIDIVN